MPKGLPFASIDVYALLDSDTDEARTFTTYMGYWMCLAEHIAHEYGDDPAPAILAALRLNRSFVRLASQSRPTKPDAVRSLLLNGWTSELKMHLVGIEDTQRLWLANHGAPIDAYYATSRMASAWLVVRDGSAPENHRGLLRAVSAQVTGPRLLPAPWNLACARVGHSPQYLNFPAPPAPCSNLASAANPHDRAAMLLRTTRERGVQQKVDETKRRLKRRRAPNGESDRQDAALEPTTLFDFVWRMRTRSNYGDPAMFYVGTLQPERSAQYAAAVRAWTFATMFLFEALLSQRARTVLEDAAVHFISRDRSQIAETLLVPRLRTLGLLAQTP